MRLRVLPEDARRLCAEVGAPARLVAHLRLVHDAACELVSAMGQRWPRVPIDRDDVAFGASTHDLGKVEHPEELTGPGRRHEAAGEALLLSLGAPARRARFARTHGEWEGGTVEDLVVALADGAWKGLRRSDLEGELSRRIAREVGAQEWEVWSALDEIISRIAEGAGWRLEWQRTAGAST